MDNKIFIILFEGKPLVEVKNFRYRLPSDILNEYAKQYAFGRQLLSYCVINSVDANDFMETSS